MEVEGARAPVPHSWRRQWHCHFSDQLNVQSHCVRYGMQTSVRYTDLRRSRLAAQRHRIILMQKLMHVFRQYFNRFAGGCPRVCSLFTAVASCCILSSGCCPVVFTNFTLHSQKVSSSNFFISVLCSFTNVRFLEPEGGSEKATSSCSCCCYQFPKYP